MGEWLKSYWCEPNKAFFVAFSLRGPSVPGGKPPTLFLETALAPAPNDGAGGHPAQQRKHRRRYEGQGDP